MFFRTSAMALALLVATPAFADTITVNAGQSGTIHSGGMVLTITNLQPQAGSATVSCATSDPGQTYQLAPATQEGYQQNVDAALNADCTVKAGATNISVSNQ